MPVIGNTFHGAVRVLLVNGAGRQSQRAGRAFRVCYRLDPGKVAYRNRCTRSRQRILNAASGPITCMHRHYSDAYGESCSACDVAAGGCAVPGMGLQRLHLWSSQSQTHRGPTLTQSPNSRYVRFFSRMDALCPRASKTGWPISETKPF